MQRLNFLHAEIICNAPLYLFVDFPPSGSSSNADTKESEHKEADDDDVEVSHQTHEDGSFLLFYNDGLLIEIGTDVRLISQSLADGSSYHIVGEMTLSLFRNLPCRCRR